MYYYRNGKKDFPKRFSAERNIVLEKYYIRGMRGWGKRYYGMIEGAAEETGLTFLQVKNWIRRRNRVERTRRRRPRQSVSRGAKLHSAKGILLRN